MDRCIRPFAEVNHAPRAVVIGDASLGLVRIDGKPGGEIMLDAAGSSDPDSDRLTYRWFHYPEPGSFRGEVVIGAADSVRAAVKIPEDASGKTST